MARVTDLFIPRARPACVEGDNALWPKICLPASAGRLAHGVPDTGLIVVAPE